LGLGPTSRVGRWSIRFAAAGILLLAMNWLGPTHFSGTLDPVAVAISTFGVVAGALALVAVSRFRERSWVLWLVIAFGAAIVAPWGFVTFYALFLSD
jgi:hypothetical protein